MDRIDRILSNEKYLSTLKYISDKEVERRFCRHGIDHLLDVARVAYITVLEKGYSFDKEMIYTVALLHDIGRYSELEKEGMSHHMAGAIVAEDILLECGYTKAEIEYIQGIIRLHKYNDKPCDSLEYIIYDADKKTRRCYMCEAYDECYWSVDLKNKSVLS